MNILSKINVIRLGQITIADCHSAQNSPLDSQRDQHVSPKASSILSSVVAPKIPKIDEEKNDIMRAGLLTKVFDHISLLVEEWFVGLRPRISVIPCPFCSEDIPSDLAKFKRSFSDNPTLLNSEGRLGRSLAANLEQQPNTQVHNTIL